MLSCKEVSQLASDRLDHDLTFWQRLQLRMHLALCKHCSRYVEQLQRLTQIARTYPEHLDAPSTPIETNGLSEQKKQRLSRLVDEELQK